MAQSGLKGRRRCVVYAFGAPYGVACFIVITALFLNEFFP